MRAGVQDSLIYIYQLQMLPSLIHKSTLALALTLIGLLGGIGTGLHWVFGCSHHYHCSGHHCGSSGRACCSSPSGNTSCSSDHCGSRSCRSELGVGYRHGSSNSLQHSYSQSKECNHNCALCQLLIQFHSSSIESPSFYVAWDNHDSIALSVPEAPAGSSRRLEHPRGPPAECS